jgi:hypothetical protein
LVPGAGIEPARLSAGDFESPASTNFTTRAVDIKPQIMAQGEAMNDEAIEDSIGNTPLVALQRLHAAENRERNNV